MEQLFSLISSYGFPMVLSIYLLFRLETLIRGLKESIDTLIILSNVESAELRRLKKEKLSALQKSNSRNRWFKLITL